MKTYTANWDGSGLIIGIVRARFQENLGDRLFDACKSQLLTLGVGEDDIHLLTVPGSLEIPIALRQLALSGHKFDAMIALGIVIRGDTYHFEIVSDVSARGVLQVSLELDMPIGNAILTAESEEQISERVATKGIAVASVAVEMANYRRCLCSNLERKR